MSIAGECTDYDLSPFLEWLEKEIRAKVPRDGKWHYLQIPVRFDPPSVGVPSVSDTPEPVTK